MATFIKQFKPYLAGRWFILLTGHGLLAWLQNIKEPEGHLTRWLEGLLEFDLEIVDCWGRKHTNMEALSSHPCRQCGRDSHDSALIAAASIIPGSRPLKEVHTDYLTDATLVPALQAKQAGQRPSKDEMKGTDESSLVQLREQLVVQNDVLYRQCKDPSGKDARLQLLVPELLREEVLADLHEGDLGGHLGVEKTLACLKECFYWPSHHQDMQNWCGNCADSATARGPHVRHAPPPPPPLQTSSQGPQCSLRP